MFLRVSFPAWRSIVLIATFKACSVMSNARYFGSVLSLRFLSDLLNFPEVCMFIFTPRLKSFELCLPLSTLSTLLALMPVMARLSAG